MKSPSIRRIVTLVFAFAFILGIPFAGNAAAARGTTGIPALPKGFHLKSHLSKSEILRLSQHANRSMIVIMKNQLHSMPTGTHRLMAERATSIRNIQKPVLNELHQVHASHVLPFTLINAVNAKMSSAEANHLRHNPLVRAVVPNLRVPQANGLSTSQALKAAKAMAAKRNATLPKCAYQAQLEPQALGLTHTAYQNSSTPQAQNYEDGAGVTVAFIADGLDPNNPDFIRPDGTPVFKYYDDLTGYGPGAPTGGEEAFGDASSIAAQGNETYNVNDFVDPNNPAKKHVPCPQIKILGMAPGASLIGINSTLYTANIVLGIQLAMRQGAQVINESFGGNPYPDTNSDPISLADKAAVEAGVTVTVSSGDAGTNGTNGSPSTLPGVIAVGATTQFEAYKQIGYDGFNLGNGKYENNNISSFSSGGFSQAGVQTVNVVAPGNDAFAVCSTNTNLFVECTNAVNQPSPIVLFGGTSESAPLTAGEAALVIEAYRTTHLDGNGNEIRPTPAIVKQIIMSSADDLHLPSFEQGAGLIDSLRAVRLAQSWAGSNVSATGDNLAIQTTNCPVTAGTDCNQVLAATGNPGQHAKFPVTVTNYGQHSQTVSPSVRTLSTKPLSSGSYDFNFKPANDPTTNYGFGGSYVAYQERKFNVPAGADHLKVAYAYNIKNAQYHVRMALLDPSGAYAVDSVPQGYGGYGQAEVHDPQPGTWTAIIMSRPAGQPLSYTGQIALQWTTSQFVSAGTVSPASATLAPGASTTFTVDVPQPMTPGDSSADLVFNGQTDAGANVEAGVIPIVLRTMVPTSNTSGGTFSGTLTGSNGRPGAANEQIFTFNVPKGLNDLDVNLALSQSNTNYNLEGVLLDPNGRVVDIQSNITSFDKNSNPNGFTNTLQFFHQIPAAGRWQLLLLINFNSGPVTSEPFTGTITFNGANVQSSGIPNSNGTTITSGSAASGTITVTNTGNTTKMYFIDPRSEKYVPISLGGGGGTVSSGNPEAVAGMIVPPETSKLSVLATGSDKTLPINLDALFNAGAPPAGFSGNPEVLGQSFVTPSGVQASSATYKGGNIPFGIWYGVADASTQIYNDTGSPTDTIGIGGVATTLGFDNSVQTSTGDIWGLELGQTTGGFSPLVLAPGQTGTINVTFNSSGKSGKAHFGNLYLETIQIANGLATTNFSGDQVTAIPFRYTTG